MQDRKRDTDVQNRLLDSVGEGEGGMTWENSTEICILSSAKSGWGTHVNPRLIHVNVGQKPLQYCKVISLQLIKINEKIKKLIKKIKITKINKNPGALTHQLRIWQDLPCSTRTEIQTARAGRDFKCSGSRVRTTLFKARLHSTAWLLELRQIIQSL